MDGSAARAWGSGVLIDVDYRTAQWLGNSMQRCEKQRDAVSASGRRKGGWFERFAGGVLIFNAWLDHPIPERMRPG
jgi:hypothetical protein